MTRKEFEDKFIKILNDKVVLRTNWKNALKHFLAFFDDHKLYNYKSYEQILSSLKNLQFYVDEKNNILGRKCPGTRAMYVGEIHAIVFGKDYLKKQTNPSTFMHELFHALCMTVVEHVKESELEQKKYRTKTGFTIPAFPYFEKDFKDKDAYHKAYVNNIKQWVINNHGLMEDAKTIKTSTTNFYSGFTSERMSYSRYINRRILRENIKNTDDLKNSILHSTFKDIELLRFGDDNKMLGIEEGVTQLMTCLICSRFSRGNIYATSSYNLQVALANQLYSIFGESLFEGYWTSKIDPMAKHQGLKKDVVKNLLADISALDDVVEELTDADSLVIIEKQMDAYGDCQKKIVGLFNRKMYREIVKNVDNFLSVEDVRQAIFSSYLDFCGKLYFGYGIEEVLSSKTNEIWCSIEEGMKNCEKLANALLRRSGKDKMRPFSNQEYDTLKIKNYYQYSYISKDDGEIRLDNRLIPEQHKMYKVSLERKGKDSQRYLGFPCDVGSSSYLIATGSDQVELLCKALDGEEELEI